MRVRLFGLAIIAFCILVVSSSCTYYYSTSGISNEPNIIKSPTHKEPNVIKYYAHMEPNIIKSTVSNEPNIIKSTVSNETNIIKSTVSNETNIIKSTVSNETNIIKSTVSNETNIVNSPVPNEQYIIELPVPNESIIQSAVKQKDLLVENSSKKAMASIDENEVPFLEGEGLTIADTAAYDEYLRLFQNNSTYYKKNNYTLKNEYKDVWRLMGEGILETNLTDPECGIKASYVECLLERHGIDASIVYTDDFQDHGIHHAWVMVKTQFNEKIYIDPSSGSDYFKLDKKYNPFEENGELKKEYIVFDNIDEIRDYHKTKKGLINFAWWCTDWGSQHIYT